MRFLKENPYDILKLFINQIGIAIFSFFLYTAVGAIDDDALRLKLNVIVSIFAIGFYFVLLYTAMWDMGAKDKIRVDSGRTEAQPFKGFFMALFANSINLILALLSVTFILLNMYANVEWCFTAFALCNTLLRFISAMYVGLFQGIFVAFEESVKLNFLLDSIGFIVMPFFAILATHLGYTLGSKEKRIFPSFKKTNVGK